MHFTEAVIKEQNGSFYVYSHDGKKKLGGPYKTKKEAVKRLQQIEYFKNKGTAMLDNDFIQAFTEAAKLPKDPAPGTTDFSLKKDTEKEKHPLPKDPAGGRTQTDLVGTVANIPSILVLDKKSHFPIETEDQATSAALRVSWMEIPPKWFSGSAKELRSMVLNAVGMKYPNLRISMKCPIAAVAATKVVDPAADVQHKVPQIERPNLENTGSQLGEQVYAAFDDKKVLADTIVDLLKHKQSELKTALKVAERLMESGVTGDEFKELFTFLQEDILRELLYKGVQANKKQEIYKKVLENRKNGS